MSNELRYLLHGNPDKYSSTENLLVTSERDSVWEKIARQALAKKNELWRLVPPSLASQISQAERENLGIREITSVEVVNLIQELGTASVDGNELTSSERDQLLSFIGQNRQNESLWKELVLHIAVGDKLFSITEHTYLENPDFPLDEGLAKIVTLIRRSERLVQIWIPKWTPKVAISIMLNQPNPHHYCNLILNALERLQNHEKADLKIDLQNQAWLSDQNSCSLCPANILHLPEELEPHIERIVSLNQGNYSASALSSSIRNHAVFEWITSLFVTWDEEDIIDFVLRTNDMHFYSHIIIDAIGNLLRRDRQVSSRNIERLKTSAWLVDREERAVIPDRVIHLPMLSVQQEVNAILTCTENEYVDSSILERNLSRNRPVFNWLKNKLFVTDIKQALQIIGGIVREVEEYWLGNFQPPSDFPLDDCWGTQEPQGVFHNITPEVLPIWSLAQKVPKEDFKKYLLPNLQNKIETHRLIRLFNWLSDRYANPDEVTTTVYNKYLELACQYSNFRNILSEIKLLSRLGSWKLPENLCYGVGDIGIEDDDILHDSQGTILREYLEQVEHQPEANANTALPQNENNATSLLARYFQPWQSHIQPELIGGFLCLLAGGDEKVTNLASLYLRRRNFAQVRERFLENYSNPYRRFTIAVGSPEDRIKSVNSLTGITFNAHLSSGRHPDNLFLGNLNRRVNELQLININPHNFSTTQLANLLKNSTKLFLERVYEIETAFFDKIWDDLANSEQLDIQVAKNHILESVPHILMTLGVHNTNRKNSNRKVKDVIDELEKAKYIREEKKNQDTSTENVDRQIAEILQDLCSVLEDEHDRHTVRRNILESVRDKITQHGYRPQSILFELFQNADDALVELNIMLCGRNLEESRLQFVVSWNQQELAIMHWGRPINLFRHPDYPNYNYRKYGFERDLVKMLTFNFSDKSEEVTGKFGLGFKSVHLICKKPQVVSGYLGFNVLAGLLPSKLTLAEIENLQQRLRQHSSIADGTLIKLAIDPQVRIQSAEVVSEFESLAGILVVFSKHIKRCKLCKIDDNQTKELAWTPVQVLGVQGIEAGDIEIQETRENSSRWIQLKALCLRIEPVEASLLICLEERSGKIESPLKKFPTIWVTAPTQEKLGLGFILNAKFNITTGREKLSGLERNCSLARQVGESVGHTLCNLFHAAEHNWTTFRETLGLSQVSQYTFWNFIWQELAVNWLRKDESDALQLIRHMMGGNRGIGYFVTHCASLPNGLWGDYQQLVSPRDVRYVVRGIMDTEEYFRVVTQWHEFRGRCDRAVVLGKTWDDLRRLLSGSFPLNTEDLKLLDVLKWELGGEDEPKADPQIAGMLSELVTRNFLQELEKSHQSEHQENAQFLQQVKFLCKESNTYYRSAKQLFLQSLRVIPVKNLKEEELLAAFAPNDMILNPNYTEIGREFFYACRGQMQSVSISDLGSWMLQAGSEEKRQAVRDYLLYGESKDSLAVELCDRFTGSWLENDLIVKKLLDIATQREELKKGAFNGQDLPPEPISQNDDGTGNKLNEELGKKWTQRLYKYLGYDVIQSTSGLYDYHCTKTTLTGTEVKQVEAKAISTDAIRLTTNKWSFMMNNSKTYELLIVVHESGTIQKLIRVKEVLSTLSRILSDVSPPRQKLTTVRFGTKMVESLIGLQQNEPGDSHDAILNWSRLIDSVPDENIEIYQPVQRNGKDEFDRVRM